MNLGKQIDSLLRRQAAVYVKDLGVFRRVHTSAKFDPKSNAFLPPISFVEFDASSTDGYDFIFYLQQINLLERYEAESQLENEVSVLIDRIRTHGEAHLDNLGVLLSFDGNYVFKPFDLSGFLYTPVENDYNQTAVENQHDILENPENIFAENRVDSAEEKPQVEPIAETNFFASDADNLVFEKELIQENPDSREGNNSYIYGLVAALAILILGGAYLYITLYQQDDTVERDFTFDSSVLDSVDNSIMVDTLDSTIAIESDSTISVEDTVLSVAAVPLEVPKKEERPVLGDYRYTIVIGTHATMEQADNEVTSYHKKGYKTVRALSPNLSKNKTRVVWDVYKTAEERDAALREVRKSIKPDAWGANI